MTTYTITEAQRQQCMDAFSKGYLGRNITNYQAAMDLLQSLEPALAPQGEKLIKYRHKNGDAWFQQLASATIPEWAVDVQPQAQQGEPLGTVVEYRNNNFGFYRWGESPYLDNALAHWIVYTAAPAQQEPHAWMIQGSHGTWKGEHAEMDAKAEAKRCGGTCYAYPLYTHPAPMRILTDAERLEREKARTEMTLEQFLVALRAQFRTRGS